MSKELEALYKISQIEFETGDYMNDDGYMMTIVGTEMYAILLKALTPPTAKNEVCEHLNESFGLKGKNTTLHFIYDKESKEFRMVIFFSKNVVYRYISTKRSKRGCY